MKAFCVAVVVLSLFQGCRPASLTCETLKKPIDKSPDFPGRWYFTAMAFDSCLVSALWSFSAPSVVADLSSTDKPNNYDIRFGFKMMGYCKNATVTYSLLNSTLHETEGNAPEVGELLQSGCHDCIVIKMKATPPILMLFSRRINITAEEMSEFQKQAGCFDLYTVKDFSTNHSHENCVSFDDRETKPSPEFELLLEQRLQTMVIGFSTCVQDRVLSYPRAAYEWAQQKWDNLW